MPTLHPILPGSTIGVLGSGQLGRMLAIAARRMGYRVITYSPETDTPTGQVADEEFTAAYDDLDRVRDFARKVDVVTFEFENVPSATANAAMEFAPVRPNGNTLNTTQHRLREKTFLFTHGFPVARFHRIDSLETLRRAYEGFDRRGVLKTAGYGYDGKGQIVLNPTTDLADAWAKLNTLEAVLEELIDFEGEVSVVAARGADGSFTHWGVVENHHHNHILDVSTAPATIGLSLHDQAIEIARGILETLQVVGVLCVEFFVTRDQRLLVNELAPRPHNSGHFTLDASPTSQFEQQLRAICHLPLGSTQLLRPAAMANLLGDLWTSAPPNWPAALAFADVKLHLYGKARPRPGRKMGHLTALADTPHAARQLVCAARAALSQPV
ncbi:MAG: 5-(carboxyamino)imidazole ribonucleotide synthase [Phycisphaerales bacterium]|nr:5-(carboxyamino)imidazole ribonucleotide synthase [Phycisphaerales bacterium]